MSSDDCRMLVDGVAQVLRADEVGVDRRRGRVPPDAARTFGAAADDGGG